MPKGATSASWTPERRKRQAQRIYEWRPWERSTGPKTSQGKAAVANNALKHGRDCRAVWSLRKAAARLKLLENESL